MKIRKYFRKPFWILLFLYIITLEILIFSLSGANYLNSTISLQDSDIFIKYFNILFEPIMLSVTFIEALVFGFGFILLFFWIREIVFLIKNRNLYTKTRASLNFLRGIIFSILKSSWIIFLGTFGAIFLSYIFALIDLQINLKTIEGKFISDQEEILRMIDKSDYKLNIYDASNEKGVILALRDLQSKEKLTSYEAIILPITAKLLSKHSDNSILYVPSTKSIVYLNFKESGGDLIISKLALNKLKYNGDRIISDFVEKKDAPKIQYVSDEEYAKFVSIKNKDLKQNSLNDYRLFVKTSEIELVQCNEIYQQSIKNVINQEADYLKNCIQHVNYSDCLDFRKIIDSNIETRDQNAHICAEHKSLLQEKYSELKKREQNIEESILEKQKDELSNGMYFFDSGEIIMRVIKDQDSFEYLKTLLHEMFHHYSSVFQMPASVEEGMTEYLTLNLLDMNKYEMVTSSGYFKEIQIIFALLEKIPEEDLIRSYLNEDRSSFPDLFKKYFPELDYSIFLEKTDNIFNGTFDSLENTNECSEDDIEDNPCDIQELREWMKLERVNWDIYN
ncbi:MAG: hypothetical protein RLY49_289 [Candidatus Parcubacteria bacterium]|jgi:hypothetical protein